MTSSPNGRRSPLFSVGQIALLDPFRAGLDRPVRAASREKRARFAPCRFARYCTDRGIAPSRSPTLTFDSFLMVMTEDSLLKRPRIVHPNLPQAYRRQMERLGEALEVGPDNVAALEAVRGLIERIILYPLPERGFEIEVLGDIAAMIRLGQAGQTGQWAQPGTQDGAAILSGSGAVSDLFVCSVKVVAGTGFEPVTFRL